MKTKASIEAQADSLMDILAAQCSDLEELLALARRETTAAQERNFEKLLEVVTERATIGERLEIYHQQIAELRMRLGDLSIPALNSDVSQHTAELVASIQAQDACTLPLLINARNELSDQHQKVNQTGRGLSAYLRDGHIVPVACDMKG
jgi:flagellar biosynthesis/type III secretory pathway chaperone